jgi:FlaA1/EpsC-like NDP-sugar epimerase
VFPKKNVPRWVVIVIDLITTLFTIFLAYLIRFDLKADENLWKTEWAILSKSLPIILLIRFVIYYFFQIHKGIIRHTSTSDFKRLFLATSISSFLFFIAGYVRITIDGYYLLPISVLIVEYVFCVFFTTISRFVIKLWYLESKKSKEEKSKVLIYGAGISGLIAKRTIERDGVINYAVVGFIDDDKKKEGTRIESTPIFSVDKLAQIVEKEKINTVILAIQNPNIENQQRVFDVCIQTGVELKKVPSVKSWINGEFSSKQIAKVNIEDLLGRKSISLNQNAISDALKGKTVLVTGAAGSIGSGLVNQIISFQPEKIILIDQAESPMYELELEMRTIYPWANIEIVIGDIRHFERIETLFKRFKPSWVFHAAAYKHVPLMENNPKEALRTNVHGTQNLVQLSKKYGATKFVMISTDKAVNPTNVMGASKRIAEMIAQFANEDANQFSTQFITTRFGNVLGSNGSVIPLFKKQIEAGGPITLTDERITRFFMTITEACQLVLEAGVIGLGGEIFVFDMGESVKIIDLAKNMVRLSGLELGKDIEIKTIGLRPGEKLFEELLNEAEKTLPTHHPKILKALDRLSTQEEQRLISELIKSIDRSDNMELVSQMKRIVPEFLSNNSAFKSLDKL